MPEDLPGLIRIATPWCDSWSPAQLQDSLAAGHHGVTLVRGDTTVGYGVYRVLSDIMEILNLVVFCGEQSKGYGHIFMQLLEEVASNAGCGTLWLEVRATNDRALSLYRSHGFETSGRREGYYPSEDGNPIDALLMEKQLQHT